MAELLNLINLVNLIFMFPLMYYMHRITSTDKSVMESLEQTKHALKLMNDRLTYAECRIIELEANKDD